jgi:hypothetical protein
LKDETKTSAGFLNGETRGESGGPAKLGVLPTMGPTALEDRFRSSLCQEEKHEECAHSALLGICGCECHDWLDDLENDLTEKMN